MFIKCLFQGFKVNSLSHVNGLYQNVGGTISKFVDGSAVNSEKRLSMVTAGSTSIRKMGKGMTDGSLLSQV